MQVTNISISSTIPAKLLLLLLIAFQIVVSGCDGNKRSFSIPRIIQSVQKRLIVATSVRHFSIFGGIVATNRNHTLLSSSPLPSQPLQSSVLPQPDIVKRTIQSGNAFQQMNFLHSQDVNELREAVLSLRESERFKPSGLSDRTKGKQEFNAKDRQVLGIDFNNLNDLAMSPSAVAALTKVYHTIKQLRFDLSLLLDRPTLADDTLAHEVYLSISSAGARLPRHLDERHEEIKGRLGWLSSSRRSLSWLIYLTDEGWSSSNGGQLKTFPQQGRVRGITACNDGDLQVGWLRYKKGSDIVSPVFLDCNVPSAGNISSNDAVLDERSCILYTVGDDKSKSYVSIPFSMVNSSTGEKIDDTMLSSYILSDIAVTYDFYKIEETMRWANGQIPSHSTAVDLLPVSGSLVIFDSVSLPHEVELTIVGNRLALAGWFHEKQQYA